MLQAREFAWLDREEYSFQSQYLATEYGNMRYVDEGSGEVVLFVHGNLSWSFMYRHLINGLSKPACLCKRHCAALLRASARLTAFNEPNPIKRSFAAVL